MRLCCSTRRPRALPGAPGSPLSARSHVTFELEAQDTRQDSAVLYTACSNSSGAVFDDFAVGRCPAAREKRFAIVLSSAAERLTYLRCVLSIRRSEP